MAHIHDKIDFVATAYVVYKDKVLLHLHKKLKIWIGVGGHIELDEDPNQTIIREVKEEAGLDVTILDPHKTLVTLKDYVEKQRGLISPVSMNIHSITDTHEHIDLVYYATSETDTVVPESPEMIFRWFSKEDLIQNEGGILAEKIIYYGLNAIQAAALYK